MSTAAPLLDVRDVAKNFNSVVALRAAALAVRPGEVHALMGANGAGKSTLVKILTGAVRPDSGAMTPVRIFTSVLLPAPLAPSSAWISPGSTTRSAERSATTGP